MFATILVSVLACTQMESPGDPFSPVQIAEEKQQPETNQEEALEEKTEDIDPLFEPVGSVVVVSEVNEPPKGEAPADNQQEEDVIDESSTAQIEKTESSKNLSKESEDVVDAKIETEQKVNTNHQETVSLGQWPLRVVKTESDLNPPRAILGLPSGEEVVIRPGMQLPEENLVVMSIGSKAVVLARIHTQGDHAQIEHLTLPSLND